MGLDDGFFSDTAPEYVNQHQSEQILTAVLVAQLLLLRFLHDFLQALSNPRILPAFKIRHILQNAYGRAGCHLRDIKAEAIPATSRRLNEFLVIHVTANQKPLATMHLHGFIEGQAKQDTAFRYVMQFVIVVKMIFRIHLVGDTVHAIDLNVKVE